MLALIPEFTSFYLYGEKAGRASSRLGEIKGEMQAVFRSGIPDDGYSLPSVQDGPEPPL